MKASTKNGLYSSTGTIRKSKEMIQEIWDMSIFLPKISSKQGYQNIEISLSSNKSSVKSVENI